MRHCLSAPDTGRRICGQGTRSRGASIRGHRLRDRYRSTDRGDCCRAARGAAARFTHAELIAACRAALDEDFSLETLRDQLAFAATYPNEAFYRYGARQELIAEVKAWALNWSTEIGLDIAESESWSDDEND